MANEIPQDVSEKLEKFQMYSDAKKILEAESRQVLVRTAALIVDALAGKYDHVGSPNTELLAGMEAPIGPVPAEVPVLEWDSAFYMGQDEHGIDRFKKLQRIGSIGEFAAENTIVTNTATAFDTGFYAGVLAARAGLVDVDKFIHDSRLPNSLDFLND